MADTWASLASLFVITYTSRCCAQHDSVVRYVFAVCMQQFHREFC